LKSTILAPIRRWTAFSAVLRMAGVASTKDKINLYREQQLVCLEWITAYRNTRFFCGSNRRSLRGYAVGERSSGGPREISHLRLKNGPVRDYG